MQIATPDSWYNVERLSDDVTLISEQFIEPYYRCNIWHVRGRDRDLLIIPAWAWSACASRSP